MSKTITKIIAILSAIILLLGIIAAYLLIPRHSPGYADDT